MSGWERLLRASNAIAGGFQLAVDHLRTHIDDDRTIPTVPRFPCPLCPGSLKDGPHFHGGDAVWSTDEEGVVLLTELDGRNALVIPTFPPGPTA